MIRLETQYRPINLLEELQSGEIPTFMRIVEGLRSKFSAVEELQKSGGCTLCQLENTVGDVLKEYRQYLYYVGHLHWTFNRCFLIIFQYYSPNILPGAKMLEEYQNAIAEDVERLNRYKSGLSKELRLLLMKGEHSTKDIIRLALINYFSNPQASASLAG